MITGRTLRSCPSTNLSCKLDTDDLGALELPWDISHNINGISTTNTTSNHAQTTGIGRVRVRPDHQSTGECVILEDDLMNDTRAGFPESHIVLQVETDGGLCQNNHVPTHDNGVTFAVEVPKKS